MSAFIAPVEDILFSLRHVAGATSLPDWDDDLAAEILGHFAGFAENELAPLNATGDAQGARLENGRVRMPDGFAAAYEQLASGGWQGLSAPEDFGGMGVNQVVAAGISEVFSGANHAFQMVVGLVPGAIKTLLTFGTEAQQAAWIPKLASGEAISTMCLTEPGAGSDLSGIRMRAQPEGQMWQLSGEKIFISGGDQDLSPEILHLVLARTGEVGDGVKGLSLFLCPAQAAVKVTRIEEKMGLHGSPTCHMVFDQAKAELIGEAGAGLRAMFTVMNHARIDVALQGVAHAARAYQISRAYADERKQGRKADGQPASLSDHADVARMLDQQRIAELSTRAMCHLALVEMERGTRPDLAEFLTPLCKIAGSEAGIQAADLGIQILGGYGYLTEYGLSQTWRDARITAIYEGANGIHARALATRGLTAKGGADAFAALVGELAEGHAHVTAKLAQWQAMADRLREMDDPLPLAHDFAQSSIELMQKAVWVRILGQAKAHHTPSALARLAQIVLEDSS